MKTKLSDLVVLRYCSPNSCYLEAVLPRQVEGLEIDLENQTFTYGRDKDIKFGQRVSCSRVLGVYNRRSMKHLNSMVHETAEAIRDIPDRSL